MQTKKIQSNPFARKIADLNVSIETHNEKVSSESAKLTAARSQLGRWDAAIETAEDKIAQATKDLTKLDAVRKQLVGALGGRWVVGLRCLTAGLKVLMSPELQKYVKLESAIAGMNQEIERLQGAKATATENRKQAVQVLTTQVSTVAGHQAAVRDAQAEVAALEAQAAAEKQAAAASIAAPLPGEKKISDTLLAQRWAAEVVGLEWQGKGSGKLKDALAQLPNPLHLSHRESSFEVKKKIAQYFGLSTSPAAVHALDVTDVRALVRAKVKSDLPIAAKRVAAAWHDSPSLSAIQSATQHFDELKAMADRLGLSPAIAEELDVARGKPGATQALQRAFTALAGDGGSFVTYLGWTLGDPRIWSDDWFAAEEAARWIALDNTAFPDRLAFQADSGKDKTSQILGLVSQLQELSSKRVFPDGAAAYLSVDDIHLELQRNAGLAPFKDGFVKNPPAINPKFIENLHPALLKQYVEELRTNA